MKTWGMIILLCLAIVGCDEERCGFVQEGNMLVNKTACERIEYLEINQEALQINQKDTKNHIQYIIDQRDTLEIRITELENQQAKNWDIWKLANTHEIKQDERIAELEKRLSDEYQQEVVSYWEDYISKSFNYTYEYSQSNRDRIVALMDYLNLEEKFISEHTELKEKIK